MRPFAVMAAVLALAAVASADRPSEKPSDAAFVVEGVVESVDVTPEDGVDYYLVAVRIGTVHKGDLTAGTVFKVSCFQVRRFKPGVTGSAGHFAVPTKGDRIKAYASRREQRGGREAIYPNWFDRLEKPAKK